MKTFFAALGTVAMLATSTLVAATPASADDFYRGHRHHNGNNALGIGLLGLGVGALIGTAIASSNSQPAYASQPTYYDNTPRYYNEAPRQYYRPAPAYYAAPRYVDRRVYYRQEPVAYGRGDHIGACMQRYRTYDARSDTFIGNDGRAHYCSL